MGLSPIPHTNRFNTGIVIAGGTITTDGVDLVLVPDTGKITIVGDAGSTSHALNSNDDLFVAGEVEIDGTAFFDGAVVFYTSTRHQDNISANFGNDNNTRFHYSTAQTPDALACGLSVDSNNLIICEIADIAVDFGFPQQTNPTVCVQSADATTPTQRICIAHDQTNGVVSADFGDIQIATVANQTLVLLQPVYEDMKVPLSRGLTGATNPPALAQFQDNGAGSVGVFAYAFGDEGVVGNEEQMSFDVELPHAYKEGTDIDAHIHWSPAAGGAAGEFVKWGLEYVWRNVDGTFGNTTIITSDASAAATATSSGDASMAASKHYITAIGTISGSGMEISSVLVCRIFRNSSHADDTLAQDAFGLEMAFHHEIDTMGSRQKFTK